MKSRWVAETAGFLVLSVGVATADEFAALRVDRAKIIGPLVATGPDYTVHSPQAVVVGNSVRCSAPSATGLSEADYAAQIDALQKAAGEENAAILQEKTALMNRRRGPAPMLYEKYLEKLKILQAHETEVAERAHEESRKLEEERRAARSAASGHLAFTVQHAPLDASATILPFENRQPSAAFVAELNRLLKPLLSDCGDRGWVTISHVYRDFFPAGVDVVRRYEKPITAFNYTLSAGRLMLDPVRNTPSWLTTWGLADDPRFTLSGARQTRQNALQEAARERAEYRRDFDYSAKRKPGIVYKLDPYWAQYRSDEHFDVDTIRRVFDGDFKGQATRQRFKNAFRSFAAYYSSQCKDDAPGFVRYRIRFSTVSGTRTYLDGHVENDYTTRDTFYNIDERFAPQWDDYWHAQKFFPYVVVGRLSRQEGKRLDDDDTSITESVRNGGQSRQMSLFFSRHGCASATTAQLRENFLRAARNHPSLQEDGVKLNNAAQDSDPPRR